MKLEKFIKMLQKKDFQGAYPNLNLEFLDIDENMFSFENLIEDDFKKIDESLVYTRIMASQCKCIETKIGDEFESGFELYYEIAYLSSIKTNYSFLFNSSRSSSHVNDDVTIEPIKIFKNLNTKEIKNITDYVFSEIHPTSNYVRMNKNFNWDKIKISNEFKRILENRKKEVKNKKIKCDKSYLTIHLAYVSKAKIDDPFWNGKIGKDEKLEVFK